MVIDIGHRVQDDEQERKNDDAIFLIESRLNDYINESLCLGRIQNNFFLSVIVVNFNVINLLSSLEPSFSIYRLVYESVH